MIPASGAWLTSGQRPLVRLLLAGMVLIQLTSAMTAVAIPTIIAHLEVGLEQAGWIISAYLLPVVLMPTWGAAGDLYGRRRVFRAGLIIFGIGAVISASASSLIMLMAGQATQAIGSGALQPNGTTMIADNSGTRDRGRALGRVRMILSSAGIIGAPLGGLLVQAAGWRAVFIAGPIVAVLLTVLLGRLGPEQRPATPSGVRFDVLGALVLSLTLLILLATLSVGQSIGWTSPLVLALAATAILGLALIGPIETRQPRPMIPPALFRQMAYTAVVITCFLQAFACFGTALLAPLLLQRVFALEPSQAGWFLASFPLGMAASGIPGGRLTDRFGGRAVTLGSLVGAGAGLVLLAYAARTMQLSLFVPGVLLTGFSTGVGLVAMSWFVLRVNAAEQHGVAMGVYSMVSIMGDAVGIALLTLLLGGHQGLVLAGAFSQVYLLAAAVALLALLPALAMRLAPTIQTTIPSLVNEPPPLGGTPAHVREE